MAEIKRKILCLLRVLTIVMVAAICMMLYPVNVCAWGDNSDNADGRPTYTYDEINAGVLDETIVFNSIKDNSETITAVKEGEAITPLTDERFFVGVRDASTGNNRPENVWETDTIEVEEGHEYIIRLYVHNNNPNGYDAVAADVTARFSFPTVPDTEERIEGYITSSNAVPNEYWDSVVFTSSNGRRFYLDYIEGSALIESNGAVGGSTLSDAIISNGVKIGYDALDGNLPGCYKYAAYVSIKVKPVFEGSSIDKKVRLLGTKEWKESVDAKVGDKVEFQIQYENLNASRVTDVIIRDSLPDNLKYVEGSTKLFSTTYPEGASTEDNTLVTDGINIGNYDVDANAYVRFTAEVVDRSLVFGNNRLINWAKASANGFAVQDSADVYVQKGRTVEIILLSVLTLLLLASFSVIAIIVVNKLHKIKK